MLKIKSTAKALSEKALGLFSKAIEGLEEANKTALQEIEEGQAIIDTCNLRIGVFEIRNEKVAKTLDDNKKVIVAINTLLGKEES